MVWGGAFDEKGSDYIRMVLLKTIDIIVNHFSKTGAKNLRIIKFFLLFL